MKSLALTLCAIGFLFAGIFAVARLSGSSSQAATRPMQSINSADLTLNPETFVPQGRTPAWSRSSQHLSVRIEECTIRARRALEVEGFAVTNEGGSPGDSFTAGSKEIHAAVIACNVAAAANSTWANVFIASYSGDGNVLAAERDQLQRRMANPAVSSSNNLSSFAGEWNASVQNGYAFTMSLSQNGNRVTGTHDGGRTIIEGVVDGRTLRFRYVYKDSSTKGAGTLVLSEDGRSMSGFYSHTDDPNNGANGSWKATRQ